ncbi:MAG: VCBS domain-containing protein [Pseudomonadota bacterium]
MAASTKTTTPASTTVKVSAQTGAAKDETFAGISEDSSTQILNVLANDPGSAYLWSIDQNALLAPAGSQQPQALASVTLASGAKLFANADGTVRYVGAAALQSLQEGEIFNDSFIYTIRMANGALSTAKSTVQIIGKNDVATFAGDKSGALTEDQSGVSGTLTVSDADHDQSAMQAASLTGSNGNLGINTDGNWSYGLTRDMNYLAAGESVVESFIVKSVDGTEQAIALTINGVNDVATFAGLATGSVQEDGTLNAGGVVTVADLDHDQSAFAAIGNLAGAFGNFTFDLQSGAWTYALRNADSNVQALATGQSVQDTLTLTSVDGTTTAIIVSIDGVNEPVAPPPQNLPANYLFNAGTGFPTTHTNSVTGFDSNDTVKLAGFGHAISGVVVTTGNFGFGDSAIADTQIQITQSWGNSNNPQTEVINAYLVDYSPITNVQIAVTGYNGPIVIDGVTYTV